MNARTLLLSAAVVATGASGVLAAHAHPRREGGERLEIHRIERPEKMSRVDANNDKVLTRAEVQAEAERVFAEMDDNNDGKLDAADRGRHGRSIHRIEIRRGDRIETGEDVIIEGGNAPRAGSEDREVIIHREVRKDGDGVRAPRPPHPPMFTMIFANSEEADRNGDNALSKEEFVTQQLRFFDAADANGDGRIKFDPPTPPTPPEAPQPPTPPQSPRR